MRAVRLPACKAWLRPVHADVCELVAYVPDAVELSVGVADARMHAACVPEYDT